MAIGKTSYNRIPLKPIGNTDNKLVTIHRRSSMSTRMLLYLWIVTNACNISTNLLIWGSHLHAPSHSLSSQLKSPLYTILSSGERTMCSRGRPSYSAWEAIHILALCIAIKSRVSILHTGSNKVAWPSLPN